MQGLVKTALSSVLFSAEKRRRILGEGRRVLPMVSVRTFPSGRENTHEYAGDVST